MTAAPNGTKLVNQENKMNEHHPQTSRHRNSISLTLFDYGNKAVSHGLLRPILHQRKLTAAKKTNLEIT